MNNSDLPARLSAMIGARTTAWVTQSQPVRWRPDAWRRHWRKNNLPCSHVLDELRTEYDRHGTIRRQFILGTYRNRLAIELFIATRAWGSGPDNRGPAQAGRILTQPDAAARMEDTVNTARTDGAAAAYSAYYDKYKIEGLGVAFVTKLLYFAAYCSPHRPRPLIYDSLVAAAAARFPHRTPPPRHARQPSRPPATSATAPGLKTSPSSTGPNPPPSSGPSSPSELTSEISYGSNPETHAPGRPAAHALPSSHPPQHPCRSGDARHAGSRPAPADGAGKAVGGPGPWLSVDEGAVTRPRAGPRSGP